MVIDLVLPANALLAGLRKNRFHKNQEDLQAELFELTGIKPSISSISQFERTSRDNIVEGVTRAHYEAVIAKWERELTGNGAAK